MAERDGRTNARKSDGTKAAGAVALLVGSKIKAARQEAALSQSALAEAAGVSFQQLQKYERGVNRVSADRLQRIADRLHKPISYFFGHDNEVVPGVQEAIQSTIEWVASGTSARKLAIRLPRLSEEDAEILAALIDRLVAQR
jgi:transcriptional regulator with XRE-family HTH domain